MWPAEKMHFKTSDGMNSDKVGNNTVGGVLYAIE
jgi:hypothetical protein